MSRSWSTSLKGLASNMDVEHHLLEVNADVLDKVMEVERWCFSDPWPASAFVAELAHAWSHFKVLVRKRSTSSRSDFSDSMLDDMVVDGYVIAWMLPDEMHLLKMAVLPEWQRKGLARYMLDDCLATFASLGGGVASLEVRPSNSAAIGLYGSFGFKQIGVRRAYYSKDNEDALLYMREVKSIAGRYLEEFGD